MEGLFAGDLIPGVGADSKLIDTFASYSECKGVYWIDYGHVSLEYEQNAGDVRVALIINGTFVMSLETPISVEPFTRVLSGYHMYAKAEINISLERMVLNSKSDVTLSWSGTWCHMAQQLRWDCFEQKSPKLLASWFSIE